LDILLVFTEKELGPTGFSVILIATGYIIDLPICIATETQILVQLPKNYN